MLGEYFGVSSKKGVCIVSYTIELGPFFASLSVLLGLCGRTAYCNANALADMTVSYLFRWCVNVQKSLRPPVPSPGHSLSSPAALHPHAAGLRKSTSL